MPAYNKTFELDLDDLDLIEESLRLAKKARLDCEASPASEKTEEARKIAELLGRLHNQKTFYRPKSGYIGG